ncbi:MAG: Omp28-related outer membrane protein [Chitinophagales bacterium]
MRSTVFFFVLVTALLLVQSCKEIGPNINLHGNGNSVGDTTYIESPVATAQAKSVMIEEFTGVRCPNCPQGHQILATIKSAHPDNVVAMSMHPINSLGAPYNGLSVMDFRMQEVQDLFTGYYSNPGFEPCAGIDGQLFSGETFVLIDKNKWSTKVDAQLATSTPVNIELSRTYDSTNRQLTMVVELHYTQNVTETNKLTVGLIESGMVTAQLNGSVIDTFYTHNDVLRTFITANTGDALSETLEPGRVIRKVYQKVLDAAWKPENMKIVAYVHEYQNSKAVYQAKELDVK